MTISIYKNNRIQRLKTFASSISCIALLLASGCGTIHVTSEPPGAMVFDTRLYPPGTEKKWQKEDILIAGFTPCSYKKEARQPGVKVRWPDGSESQWKAGQQDYWGWKDENFSFRKSEASRPSTSITNWFPVVGPTGYVEFYVGKVRPPKPFHIYQVYGTEECLVCDGQSPTDAAINSVANRRGINAIQADKRGRVRIPCQPGVNTFAVGLGTGRVRVTVNVKEGTLTPVRIDYTKLSSRSQGAYPTDNGIQFVMPGQVAYHFRIDTVVWPPEIIKP